MYRVILILSLLPILIGLLLNWWCGSRVLFSQGRRMCRCDLGHWKPERNDDSEVLRSDDRAIAFGRQLREMALADWKSRETKAAKARENNQRFGIAVPPLSAVVAVFAVVVGKIPAFGALAIFIAATAVSTVIGLMSLPAELAAITRYAKSANLSKSFPNSFDEEAVMRCAIAHAWDTSLPAILKWIKPSR